MIIYADRMRHLVCEPYSIENLHRMAEVLDIKRCWFHHPPLGWAHYDIPKKRIEEILSHEMVTEITPREMVKFLSDKPRGNSRALKRALK